MSAPRAGNRLRRTLLSCAVGVVTVTATPVGALRATTMIEITATTDEPAVWLAESTIDILVSNPGTDPLSSVVVTADGDAGASATEPMSGPEVVDGDADTVLDPGETWAYRARFVNKVYGESHFTVTAEASDGSQVVARAAVTPEIVLPAEVRIETDTTSVAVGDTVRWEIATTNVSDFVFDIWLEARTAAPGYYFESAVPVDPPFDRGDDGDITFDPGETWRWEHTAVVTFDGSYLEVGVGVDRPDVGAGGVFRDAYAVSPPLTVTDQPTTTQSPTSPPDTTTTTTTDTTATTVTSVVDTTTPTATPDVTGSPGTTSPADDRSDGSAPADDGGDGIGSTAVIVAAVVALLAVGGLMVVRWRGHPDSSPR